MFQFLDAVSISGTKETAEGYLIADAFAVRTGTQIYAGHEVGKPTLSTVTVYRPESEVFHKDTLQSFSHVPITNDHPPVAVTSDNWKKYSIGESSTDILRDGEKMKIPVILKDKVAINDAKSGKRELSAGYSCDLEFVDGVTPDGIAFQAIQRNIRANHIALVARGRAGPEFRIGDSKSSSWGLTPLNTQTFDRELPAMEKFVIDGITIETTTQGVQALTKLQQQLDAHLADKSKITTDHTSAIVVKDTEIGSLKLQLADAEKKIPTAETLDKMVADRLVIVDQAKKLAPKLVTTGLSDAELRRAAVVAKYGEELVKDSSEAEIAGMFKAAVKDADTNGDPLRKVMLQADGSTVKLQQVNDNGQAEYETRLTDAWKTPAVS